MALIDIGGMPVIQLGAPGHGGILPTITSNTLDAVNECVMMIGHITTSDGGSHTIDTTGSSSLGWRTSTTTFANAATTVVVGLAAVDTAAGPPARAVNASNVITFDVSVPFTGGGGGITSNAWHESVPTAGTKTVANGDLLAFCIQMTARGGVDSVLPQGATGIASGVLPVTSRYVAAAFGATSGYPNAVITFSDGAIGYFSGGQVHNTTQNSITWNNGSGTKEYGNLFIPPFPIRIYGLYGEGRFDGNADIILYSDPLGTPVAEKTISIDLNVIGVASSGTPFSMVFPTPYSTYAKQPLAAIFKPTSATNIQCRHLTLNAASHMASYHFGTNGYAVNRASGAFAAQNSSKDRFGIGLLVGAFEQPARPTYALGI